MTQTKLMNPKVNYSRGSYNRIKGDTQAIRITEGCPNNCPYCYEPTEFKIFGIPKIERNNVLIYDMNLIAKPEALNIIKTLGKIKVKNKNVYYEFVCGVDYRFMTDEIAKALKSSRIRNIRMAWDWEYTDQRNIRRAILMLLKANYKPNDIMIFMVCNWKIPFEENCMKLDLCKVWNVKVADCYFDNQTFPNVQPVHWTLKDCKTFRQKVRKHNQIVNFKIDPELNQNKNPTRKQKEVSGER